MSRARTGSLRKNLQTFFAMLESESMSAAAYDSYKKLLTRQVEGAERIAIDTPIDRSNSYDLTLVCGSPDALPLTKARRVSAPKLAEAPRTAKQIAEDVAEKRDADIVQFLKVPRRTAYSNPPDNPPTNCA